MIFCVIFLICATISLEASDMPVVSIHSIQRATTLANALAGTASDWDTATVQGPIEVGYGQQLGSVTILEPLGTVIVDGVSASVGWTDRCGQWVAIRLQGAGGPEYWYRITAQQLTAVPAESGDPIEAVEYSCVGAGILLADRAPMSQKYGDGATTADLDVMAGIFNPNYGEGALRPTYNVQSPDYVLTYDNSDYVWDPLSLLTYLAQQWTEEQTDGSECVVYASSEATTYLYTQAKPQTWDLTGMSYLEAIATILNSSRGVGFFVSLSGGEVRVEIDVTGGRSISVDGDGNFTVTARSGATLDLSALNAGSYSVSKGDANIADTIIVTGDPLWIACTLDLTDQTSSALVSGWDSALETDWDSVAPSEKQKHVWRRFVLSSTWDQLHESPVTPGVVNDRGSHPWTGDITYVAGSKPPVGTYTFTESLPVRRGEDWTAATPPEPDPDQPYQPISVFTLSGTDWARASDSLGVDITVLPSPDGKALEIHPQEAAQALKDWVEGGDEVYFTVGLEAPLQCAVSWQQTGIGRTLVAHVPGATQAIMMGATLLDVDEDGDEVLSHNTTNVINDGIDALRSVLAEKILMHADSRWNVTASLPEFNSSYSPGDLITTLTLGDGTNLTVAATVQRIVHTPGAGTTIVCGVAPATAGPSL